MGAERKSSYIDEKVKRMTAYHEVEIHLSVLDLQASCSRFTPGWTCTGGTIH